MRLHILLIIALLLAAGVAESSIQVTETWVTPWGTNQDDPAVETDGDYVVYVDSGGGTDDVHMMVDGVGPVFIATGAADQNEPAIDGGLVVYTNHVTGSGDIYLYEISEHRTTQLTYSASDEFLPRISVDNVLYLSDRSGNWDIYRYSLSEERELPVVISSTFEEVVSIDGDLLAWHVAETSSYNIYAKTIGGATITVADGPGDQWYPSVSGELIAYIVDGNVAVFNVTTGLTTYLPASAYSTSRVRIDGHMVVFDDKPQGNKDIFLYDLTTSTTYQLTDDPADQYLTDIDGSRIVYWDTRTGDKNVWQLDWVFVNDPPVADAGEDQYVDEGDTVHLSGAGDDPNGDPIVEWQWSFTDLPFGSAAELDDPAIQSPSFVADVSGDYVLSLVVSDGTDPSDPDEVTITAEAPCAEPVAILDVDPTEGDAPLTVTFDASSSYDPYENPLYSEWEFGDGSPTETDPVVVHTYTESGEYNASLYLYNDCGMDVLVPIGISVSATGVPGDGPLVFALYPSSPNPFHQGTTIAYDLGHESEVDLSIYDVSGRLVRRLRAGSTEGAGRHEAAWDGRDSSGNSVAAGTYIYRLEASGYVASSRMTLLK